MISVRNNYAKIMNIFPDLFYNHVHNLKPVTDLKKKKTFEKSRHSVPKLDTHVARTAHIYGILALF